MKYKILSIVIILTVLFFEFYSKQRTEIPSRSSESLPRCDQRHELFGYEQEVLSGKVIHVMDGDSLRFRDSSRKVHEIRLAAIDAPERGQRSSEVAKNALRQKVLNKQVQVSVLSSDQYGRSLSVLCLGDEIVNISLLREGFAWYYRSFSNNPVFLDLERKARSEHLGLWADLNPVSPRDFKRKSR